MLTVHNKLLILLVSVSILNGGSQMNYYIEEAYYPTVKELLKLPIFSTSYLAAGESGLNRTVSGINLSDNPDYGQWISPGD